MKALIPGTGLHPALVFDGHRVFPSGLAMHNAKAKQGQPSRPPIAIPLRGGAIEDSLVNVPPQLTRA